ncbi:MAG TPA: S8 family serine peptidase [Blastocatellia bacterium]|nr:S8 family serine peptidase [Blastocatellia bacterium]
MRHRIDPARTVVLLTIFALLSALLLPKPQLAASRIDQTLNSRQEQSALEKAGVQPTSREASEFDSAVSQLDPTLREKIAPDLAPVMVDGGQTAAADAQEAIREFSSPDDTRSSDVERSRVIVQTYGPPSDDLLAAAAIRSNNNALMDEVEVSTRGAVGKSATSSFESLNGFVAELTAPELRLLASMDDVSYISPDRVTHSTATPDTKLRDETGDTNVRSSYGLNGEGVGIAFLDSGIDWNHPTFEDSYGRGRVSVVVDAVTGESTFSDVYGHGSAVAGAAAGLSYGSINGIASGSTLLSVRVLNSNGQGTVSDAIRALDWCVANAWLFNIQVINMSMGAASVDSFTNDPLCQAAERAVNAGIVVVTAAGNNGKDPYGREVYGSITSPGNDPLVITVGSANTRGTGKRSDDIVNTFSSRGPTLGYKLDSAGKKQYDFVLKPDLVAPGNAVVTAKVSGSKLISEHPELTYNGSSTQMMLSGTSIASGVVAGSAAVLLQANSGLTPGLIKAILQYSAQPIPGANVCQQGAGLLNLYAAVKLAKSLKNPSSLSAGNWLCLYSSLPSLATTITNESCATSGVIFSNMNHVWAGSELFLRYQLIYKPGILWYGTSVKNNGVLVTSGTVMTSGIRDVTVSISNNNGMITSGVLASGVILSSGVIVVEGVVLSEGVIMTEGVTLSQGVSLGESVTLSEGVIIAEGVVVAEGVIQAAGLAQSAAGEP